MKDKTIKLSGHLCGISYSYQGTKPPKNIGDFTEFITDDGKKPTIDQARKVIKEIKGVFTKMQKQNDRQKIRLRGKVRRRRSKQGVGDRIRWGEKI